MSLIQKLVFCLFATNALTSFGDHANSTYSEEIHRQYGPTSSSSVRTHRFTVQEELNDYHNEGIGFLLMNNALVADVALWSCKVTGPNIDYFLSTSPTCEGQTKMDTRPLGYLFSKRISQRLVPLSRCYNQQAGDHLFTINSQECVAAGYVIENKSVGYVIPGNVPR